MSSIDKSQLLAELKIAAAQAKNIMPQEESSASNGFGEVLSDAMNKVNDLQLKSGELQHKFELADPTVELPDVMIAMQKSRVAFTAMSEVRNKLVSAYQDIMNMPV